MTSTLKICPHCKKNLVKQSEKYNPLSFKSYVECPYCGGKFTVDSQTKYRQARAIIISLVSLAFTLLWYYNGIGWLTYAIVSWIVLGLYIYQSDKKVSFVPYHNGESDENNL